MTDNKASLNYRHVLVPLDGSDFAAAAMSTGRALAERLGAELHTVSAVSAVRDGDRLRAHAARAAGLSQDDSRICVAVGATPAAVIERRARELEPALLCMSTHGRGRIIGAALGSAARSILQRLREPIIAVGPSAERRPMFASRKKPAPLPTPLSVPRLLACLDGTTRSEQVLPVAATWARALGMTMSIVSVVDKPPQYHRDAQKYVARLGEQWQRRMDDVTAELLSDPLSPADGIKAHLAVCPAGIVAVTTHAREGFRRLRLGATAASIVRVSDAPTLVVPLT